jgi:hypothetical protein
VRSIAAVVVALAALASVARAEIRAVVDRADLEPSTITGARLRVYLSTFETGGKRVALDDSKAITIKLFVGASELKQAYALGTFAASGGDVAIVIAIQGTIDFVPAFSKITGSLDSELLAQPAMDRAQVAVVTFGDKSTDAKLVVAKAARAQVTGLTPESSSDDPGLLDTVERAINVLKKAGAASPRPLRKIVVVIADGRDRAADRERVTRLGQKAAAAGVRIDTIAFSANDQRRSMLVLGELSKRSLGVFRWVRNNDDGSWTATTQQLLDEIANQAVLTYFVGPDADVLGKKLHVVTTGRFETTTNDVKIPAEPTCGGQTCEAGAYCVADACTIAQPPHVRGILGWILLIGGIAVGAIVVLGVIGFVLTKMKQRPKRPVVAMPMAGMPVPQPQGRAGGAAPAPFAATVASLYVASGSRAGAQLPLRHGFTIGKLPQCDLALDDGNASAQHAMLALDAQGAYHIYDLGSTNGTFVDGAQIRDHTLAHGQTIKIGSTELRFLAQ